MTSFLKCQSERPSVQRRAESCILSSLTAEEGGQEPRQASWGLDRHSGEGSRIPALHRQMRSRKKLSGHSDRVLAQNFKAVLAVVAKSDGGFVFCMFSWMH